MREIKFPVDCISATERTEYCYRAKEILRLEHNIVGAWYNPYKPEITREQYDSLSEMVRKVFPFKTKLTLADWRTYEDTIYMPMNAKMENDLLQARAELKASTRWDINLDNIIEEK